MSEEESKKGLSKAPTVDDDAATIVGANDSNPASLVYIPEDHSFAHESTTLIDGQAGSSSKMGSLGARRSAIEMDSSLQKIKYNENKVSLDRAINQTIELLYELTEENKERPVFYPANTEDDGDVMLNSKKAHLALVRKNVSVKQLGKAKMLDDDDEGKIPDFRVLRLNVKMGHQKNNSESLMAALDKQAIAKLLEQQLQSQVKYLLNLKDRVDDTSSKVFVTGDLNAGKSTFCNALLRRKLLPEDQQPCTSVFCEVIDAKRENRGIEEVHAIPIGVEYDIRDESSYDIHPVKELEDLVYECDRYSILKVYVLDQRAAHESLLSNGVVDVKLIDAPGLNMDSYQTTQVFSRQEEIDLVVFVVNSENHFTLSAKEFIAAAAAEKRYVFIVVNKFDNIKDKNKCMAKILDQVKGLSPDTHKNAKEFVHFVSSSGFEDPDGGDDDNNNNNDDDPDFDHLEASLRKFLLDKRSISKLLPAKSYLKNLLNDLKVLSELNEKVYEQEKQHNLAQLNNQIAPQYDEILMKSVKINDSINSAIENKCTDIYNRSKQEIQTTIEEFGDKQVVPYLGLQYLYEYAVRTQRAMIETVLSSVQYCEDNAKISTSEMVEEVTKIGQKNLGDEFLSNKVFKSDLMFTRKRDTFAKKLDDSIEVSDFFDPNFDSFVVWLGIPSEIVSNVSNQVSYFNPVGLLTSIPTSALSLKNQIPSQLTLHTVYSSTKLLTIGAVARKLYSLTTFVNTNTIKRLGVPIILGATGLAVCYLVYDIPNAFPRKQARKLRKQMLQLDYPHLNAYRISQECRQVLSYPARQVMTNFQTSIDKRSVEKERIEKNIADADLSYGYFRDLLKKIQHQQKYVDDIDLESINLVE
ncbi:mitofusin Fzo1p [[Candida] anglica]